jgi:hypothetical protein
MVDLRWVYNEGEVSAFSGTNRFSASCSSGHCSLIPIVIPLLKKATIQSESFVLVVNSEQLSHTRLGMIGSHNVEKERLLLLQVFVATI